MNAIIGPLIGTIIGGLITTVSNRYLFMKQTNINARVSYLKETFEIIEKLVARKELLDTGDAIRFESAIAQLQFLGDNDLQDLLQEIAINMRTQVDFTPDWKPILLLLRDEIRQSLGIKKLNIQKYPFFFYRFKKEPYYEKTAIFPEVKD